MVKALIAKALNWVFMKCFWFHTLQKRRQTTRRKKEEGGGWGRREKKRGGGERRGGGGGGERREGGELRKGGRREKGEGERRGVRATVYAIPDDCRLKFGRCLFHTQCEESPHKRKL